MFARSSVFLDCTLMIAYLNQKVESSLDNLKGMVTTYHMGEQNVENMTTIGSRDPTPDRSVSLLNYSGL